jgi:hypothetical protein
MGNASCSSFFVEKYQLKIQFYSKKIFRYLFVLGLRFKQTQIRRNYGKCILFWFFRGEISAEDSVLF